MNQQPLELNSHQLINPDQFVASGPVFEIEPGWGGKLSFWLKSNFEKIILPILAVAVLFWGLFLYVAKIQTKDASLTSPGTEKILNSRPAYKQTAQKGQGITHLARTALASYLALNQDLTLAPEHKIYIEDYLQNKTGSQSLEIGEQIEFSLTDIQSGIEKAKRLKKEDLENLSKYVKRTNIK